MLLNEDYGNLNKINGSLLAKIKHRVGEKLTPTTEVEIDKLAKDEETGQVRKTWMYATEQILDRSDVLGIVVRSNKRQLMLIIKNGYNYDIYWSDICENLDFIKNTQNGMMQTVAVNLPSIRRYMENTVRGFIEAHEKAKKNWDIMVIKDDMLNIHTKQQDRKNKQKGIIPLPRDEQKYKTFVNQLQQGLKQRLVAYSNNKLTNSSTKEELFEFIKNYSSSLVFQKIKVLGGVWELNDASSSLSNNSKNITIYVRYSLDFRTNAEIYDIFNHYVYMVIEYETDGLNSNIIKDVLFSKNRYNQSDSITFAEMSAMVDINKQKTEV
jgi:hypothetical protein